MNPSFSAFEWQTGQLFDLSAGDYPTRLHALAGNSVFHFREGSTYYIFQHTGLSYINGRFPLPKNHYAAATINDAYLQSGDGALVLIIERVGFTGLFMLGGPVEKQGRLKYIDGCTDSLLIPPVKLGDPCLNHLHFPAGISQTMHTHPTVRVGLVIAGHGECVTPFGNVPLFSGQIFIIHPENGREMPETVQKIRESVTEPQLFPVGSHCFRTFDGTMDVIAYHPDSDFGPQDEDHPMINRTIVNGISANQIDEIKTK